LLRSLLERALRVTDHLRLRLRGLLGRRLALLPFRDGQELANAVAELCDLLGELLDLLTQSSIRRA